MPTRESYRETLQMRLRAAYFALHRHSNRHFLQFDMTADQYVLLSYLAEEDGITQQELSCRCSSDARTIGTMIDLLERKELVERQPHPSDRRKWQVFLTDAGKERHAQLKESSEVIRQTLYDALDSNELAVLQKTLDRIAGAFGKPPQKPTGRGRRHSERRVS